MLILEKGPRPFSNIHVSKGSVTQGSEMPGSVRVGRRTGVGTRMKGHWPQVGALLQRWPVISRGGTLANP